MSHSSLSSEQFKGVLHGVDSASGSKFSMPVEGSRQDMVQAGKFMREQHGVTPNEHSHEGSCEQAGCKFSDINYGHHFDG